MKIAFTIPGASKTTAQHKGVMVRCGRVMFFKKKEIVAEENRLTRLCMLHCPKSPFFGAVQATITFVFPFTKAEEKKHKERAEDLDFSTPKITRPDVDNCAKTLMDVLTKQGFWVDDSQVTTLILCKRSGWTPAIHVEISEL
jgi:Holliday junction resolvase RusA-like endonuclease